MATESQKQAVADALDYNRELLEDTVDILPEQVIKNIETIASYQERYKQNIRSDRRLIAKIASIFGRPQFLYFQIAFYAVWIACTQLAEHNIIKKNFPLFELHLHGLEIASLLITTEVLIDQNRQEEIDKERDHLILQVNLLNEQKVTKIIALLEELRADLPNVRNRQDEEAEMMKQSADPEAILEIIQKNALHSASLLPDPSDRGDRE